MNILTWDDTTQSGAFQNSNVDGIFSDMVTVKPVLSFEFTNLQYISINNTFTVDGRELTAAEKAEIETIINQVTPPTGWTYGVRSAASNRYLRDTDWYVIRQLELGTPIPADIVTERQAARDQINGLKVALNYTPPQAQL